MKAAKVIFFLIFLANINIAQWVQTNGPYSGDIRCLIFHNSYIFAGTMGDGIYVSSNNGESWKTANNGINCLIIHSFAESGSNLFAGTCMGVFLSTNNGTSWQSVNNGLVTPGNYLDVHSLAVSGDNIFAGLDGGVGISSDNGANWMISGGVPSYLKIHTLAVSGANIYAGTDYSGVYCSSDNGLNWQAIGLADLDILALVVFDSTILAATLTEAVKRSTDNGANWTQVECYGRSFTVVGDTLYSCHDGICMSVDSGLTWTDVALVDTVVNVIAVHGSNIFAGTFGGIFRSTDNGIIWSRASTGINNTNNILYKMGSNLITITSEFNTDNRVYISSDNGDTWAKAGAGTVSLIQKNVNTFFSLDKDIFAATDNGVYVSTDEGVIWSTAGLGDKQVVTLASLNNYLFAGVKFGAGKGIYRSADKGKNWAFMGQPGFGAINSFAVMDPFIIAITPFIHRSSNHGVTWTQQLPNQTEEGVLISVGEKIFGGGSDVVVSNDSGKTWQEIESGLPDESWIQFLAAYDTTIFTLIDGSIFQCTYNNNTWSPADSSFYASTITINGSYMFAVVPTRGIWRKSLSGVTSTEDLREFPDAFLLEQNYPNPFNPKTVIEFTIPHLSHVTVTVYDLLGRETARLVDEEKAAGRYKTEFNASNLPSGMYLYQIKSDSYIKTKKMMVVK
jgi:hypothetical protein